MNIPHKISPRSPPANIWLCVVLYYTAMESAANKKVAPSDGLSDGAIDPIAEFTNVVDCHGQERLETADNGN